MLKIYSKVQMINASSQGILQIWKGIKVQEVPPWFMSRIKEGTEGKRFSSENENKKNLKLWQNKCRLNKTKEKRIQGMYY